MAPIWTRCSNTGRAVQTGITTAMVNFNTLPDVAVPMCCVACGETHAWRPSTAWIQEGTVMARFQVKLFKNILTSDGHSFRCLQSTNNVEAQGPDGAVSRVLKDKATMARDCEISVCLLDNQPHGPEDSTPSIHFEAKSASEF
jgi:hypothetical protein